MIIHGGINSTYGAVATDGVRDYVWIPRFAYQKESKEKQFVREISRISTYDKGLREDEYIVPNEFEEKTGIWRLKEDLEKELEDLTTITLTYDKNCEEEVTNLPSEIVVDPNVEIEISSLIPERENYLFKEWNTQADGNGTTYQLGDKITITNDIILYAIWDNKYVNIVFNKNCEDEVTNIPSDIVAEKGTEISISAEVPEREGYAFKHWCTGANGTGTIYQPGDKRTISKDITLYAIWKKVARIEVWYEENSNGKVFVQTMNGYYTALEDGGGISMVFAAKFYDQNENLLAEGPLSTSGTVVDGETKWGYVEFYVDANIEKIIIKDKYYCNRALNYPNWMIRERYYRVDGGNVLESNIVDEEKVNINTGSSYYTNYELTYEIYL